VYCRKIFRRDKMKFRNWLVVTAVIAVVVVGSVVFGQVQIARADDISGTADNVTATTITVGNQTLVIDDNTTITGDLVAGASIQIRATVQADGTLLANMIKVRNNNPDNECVYSGNNTVEKPGNNGNHFGQIKKQEKNGQWHQDNGKHLGDKNKHGQAD
jgi:hypothetical protein